MEADVEALVREALDSRPDVVALNHAVAAAEADLRLARRQTLPDLTVGARYDAIDGDPLGLAVVGLEVPLFRLHQGDRVTASARLERLRAERDALALTIEAEVRSAWARREAAAGAVKLYDDEVLVALDANIELLTTMFEAGKVAYADVATFQRERLSGALGVVEARLELGHAELGLRAAAGLPLNDDGTNGGAR